MENNEFISSANVEINALWENIKEELAKEVSTLTYDVWIENLDVVDLKENTLIVSTQTKGAKDMLQNKLKKTLFAAAITVFFSLF